MINAAKFGFSPSASPEANSAALQRAVDIKGDIIIDAPGVYEINKAIVLHSNTHIHFVDGVVIKRIENPDNGHAFINEGAYTRKYDENIEISGLHYLCNGTGNNQSSQHSITGLRGHLAFFYVKNLVIRDFFCPDVTPDAYCIHICTFENVLIENVKIEGKKDAVHFGRGKNFTVRHGHFRTFDDPIALNAHDYATANPELGWIEDGLIEDCYDYDEDVTTGFFCRILAGSWCDWQRDMPVQNSDTVVHNGRVYRVKMKPDGEVYRSVTPPTHTEGAMVLDGIQWVMIQDHAVYSCGCRNIHFKDIHLKKRRPVAFSIHFDNDNWSRSVYPGSEMPVQEGLIFENIYVENETQYVLSTVTPASGVVFKNLVGDELNFNFFALSHCMGKYPESDMKLSGLGEGTEVSIECRDGRALRLEMEDCKDIVLNKHGDVTMQ